MQLVKPTDVPPMPYFEKEKKEEKKKEAVSAVE